MHENIAKQKFFGDVKTSFDVDGLNHKKLQNILKDTENYILHFQKIKNNNDFWSIPDLKSNLIFSLTRYYIACILKVTIL